MGRKCHCKLCKRELDSDTAYVVITGATKPVKTYYCSQKEYEAEIAKKVKIQTEKDAVYAEIKHIFGYEIKNSQLFKEWKEWNALKNNVIILKYLQDNEDKLIKALSRISNVEYNRIRYFSSILKNNLHDYQPKQEIEPPKVAIDETIYTTTATNIKRRRSLTDLEDEI